MSALRFSVRLRPHRLVRDTRHLLTLQRTNAVQATPFSSDLLEYQAASMVQFEDILRQVQSYRAGEDLSLLRRAYEFTALQHANQKRLSGEPFISHPLEVVHILAGMKMDPVCLVAGMLHDVIEDTHTTTELVQQDFGAEVARIVEGVTKISRIKFLSPEEQQAENFRKMVLAMVDDIRVVLVKLADRLHNMRTLEFLPPDRRERMARETLEIYAPIAHRLGMGKVRGELEDLAFRHLEPEAFEDLKRTIESRRKVSDEFLAEVRAQVEAKMKETNIPARVEGRVKRLYSIWQKLRRQQIPIEQVYDLLAVRIITDNVKNCYARPGSHSQHVAARPRPHQGFHRHPAPQPLSVAAHFRHRAARPAV